jgi:hypothetical protein
VPVFEVGQSASYKSYSGTIRFVDEEYITLGLTTKGPTEAKILIFPHQFLEVQLHHTK